VLDTLPTPIFSRVANAVRHLILPALVLSSAACDNPTEPVRPQPARPSFARTAPGTSKGQILVTSGSPELKQYLVDAAAGTVNQLTFGAGDYQAGSWSADFSKITYAKGLWGGLWIMDADGSNETQVLAMPVRSQVFSPDGKMIAFIANPAGNPAQVFTVDIATKVVTQVTNLPGIGLRVSWSFDGKKLLFARLDGTSGNLFTIAPDGTNLKQITRCKMVCWDGQFSPDGTQIAFIYNDQVATMAASGGQLKLFTSPKEPWPHWPTWSPKGDQLAYERYAPGYSDDIWVVDLANGTKKAVMTSRLDDTTPSWSR